MEGVVIVVVPLRAIFAARRIGERIEQARLVGVVFQHQMDVPPGLRGERADRFAQLAQQHGATGLDDRMHRIEPQAVEAEVAQPIAARSRPRTGAPPAAVVDRVAPRRVGRRKNCGA